VHSSCARDCLALREISLAAEATFTTKTLASPRVNKYYDEKAAPGSGSALKDDLTLRCRLVTRLMKDEAKCPLSRASPSFVNLLEDRIPKSLAFESAPGMGYPAI
jgi:hypothetical protein